MTKNLLYYTSLLGLLFLGMWSCTSEPFEAVDPTTATVALREVGHELLLSQGDSTSRVLSVEQQDAATFSIRFEQELAFDPGDLFLISERVLKKTNLPKDHTLAVFPCNGEVVVYSYRYRKLAEKSLLPCGGRLLPKDCYILQVTFEDMNDKTQSFSHLYILISLLPVVFLVLYFLRKRKQSGKVPEAPDDTLTLGQTTFYPTQLKLLVAAKEVALSRKESELLVILAERPNEVVTREELTKRVWEDHGVVVGRSLDTYISKLRKKLQHDEALQITNVHGVGYKLEVSSEV